MKRGFTLFEFILVIFILFLIVLVAQPILLYIIKSIRLSAYKTSALNAIDAVRYHIANSSFNEFDDLFEINELDLDLKNNKFDSGYIKKTNESYQVINLTKKNYCASGTYENMKVTDNGCGSLDETAPTDAKLFIKNATNNSITLLASAKENDSKLIKFEFSIDGGKYINAKSNEYTFKDVTGKHEYTVRITNEANLSITSNPFIFDVSSLKKIDCYEKDNLDYIQTEKNITCVYPLGDNYRYEYKINDNEYQTIKLENDSYTFNVKENSVITTRIISNDIVISTKTININNIEKVLNGAYPVLLNNMIPVVYDGTNWIKADSKTIYYDYQNKNWANTVIVNNKANSDDSNSKSRNYYLSDEAIGMPIYEKDIIAFYVWIPRFKYKLFNLNNKIDPFTIDVAFQNNKDFSNGTKVDEYLTHPAFTAYGNINGFWVNKFQAGSSTNSSCYNNLANCNDTNIILYSIPNTKSVTNIQIAVANESVNKMQDKNNIYGFTSENYPHILTNLEWGAISYLTNSIYGFNQNLENNNLDYKNNLSSSTTGNITGVYDMISKNSEFVMGNYNQDPGKSKNDNSGFTDLGNFKWPNIIDYYSGITSKNRLLGDATGETAGWYNSYNNFVNGENPFMIRGGNMNSISSIFNYDSYTGNAKDNISFRTAIYSE